MSAAVTDNTNKVDRESLRKIYVKHAVTLKNELSKLRAIKEPLARISSLKVIVFFGVIGFGLAAYMDDYFDLYLGIQNDLREELIFTKEVSEIIKLKKQEAWVIYYLEWFGFYRVMGNIMGATPLAVKIADILLGWSCQSLENDLKRVERRLRAL